MHLLRHGLQQVYLSNRFTPRRRFRSKVFTRLSRRLSFALPSLGVTVPWINALISADVIRLSWSRSAAESMSASAGTALPCFAGTLLLTVIGLGLRFRPPRYSYSQQDSQTLDVMFTALKAAPADDPVNSARIFDSFCKRGHRLARQHLFFRVFRSEFAAQPASVLLICLNKIGFVLRKCRQHKPGLPIVLHLLLAISRNALSRRTAARDQVWPVAGSVARLRRCAPALARPSWSRCRGVAARLEFFRFD